MSKSVQANINVSQPVNESGGFVAVVRRLIVVVCLIVVFMVSASLSVVLYFRGTTIQVPSVVGKTRAEAEQMLRDKNLKMKVVAEDSNDKVPSGSVFEQDPKANTDAKEGSAVDVKISSGKHAQS